MSLPLIPDRPSLRRLRGGRYRRSEEYLANECVWDRVREEQDLGTLCLSAAEAICSQHGLEGRPIKFSAGFAVVFGVGPEHVIKLYSPYFAEDRRIEATALTCLSKLPGIPTPEVIGSGEVEGWPYLVMTRLHGQQLSALWPSLAQADRLSLAKQVGVAVRELHGTAVGQQAAALRVDWVDFVRNQAMGCERQQSGEDLDPQWLEQIGPFLSRILPELEEPEHSALLHCELTDGAFFAEQSPSGWELSGLCDFGDAFVGHPEYDLGAPAVFIARGEPGVYSAFLSAYGATHSSALCRRLLAYLLLHPYSSLPWYMRKAPPGHDITSLDDLAEFWFGG